MNHRQTNTEVHDALVLDHHRLDALLHELCCCAASDAPFELDAAWGLFEREMLAHLDREEMLMLPVFDRYAPREAKVFRSDHARIRARMGELGVLIELHAIRRGQIEEFAAQLRDHAAREDGSLYRWADEGLPAVARPSLLRRLGRAVERATNGAPIGTPERRAPGP